MKIELAITDCLVEKDGKFLVVAEGKPGREGKFNLPGGHVEPEETFFEAIVREVFEESGYEGELTGFVGIYQNIYLDKQMNVGGPVFLARVFGGEATPSAEHPTIRWVDAEEVARMQRDGEFWPAHPAAVVADYIRRGAFPLEAVVCERG